MKKLIEFLLEWKEYIISYNQNPFHSNDIKRVQVLVPTLHGGKLLVDTYDIKEIKDLERILINAHKNVEITIQLILKNYKIANIYITYNPESEFDIDYYEFVKKLKEWKNDNSNFEKLKNK